MRISRYDLTQYVKSKTGKTKIIRVKTIAKFPMLLQNNYGLDQDCTLTSITALAQYKNQFPDYKTEDIYSCVEQVALKYGYDGNKRGTNPLVIRNIINKIFLTKSKIKIFKNLGYNFETIVEQINKNNPIVLSLYKSGNGSYDNHTVSILGYVEYEGAKMLIIADNWYKDYSYIDYDKLSFISQINYL